MNDSVYEALRSDFVTIRHLHSGESYDKTLFNQTIDSIQKLRKKIAKESKVEERQLLLYCIDTLLAIIDENNEKKIFDFADTIHNIPEICLRKRDIYSFHKEIRAFQKEYGKNYFPNYKKVKPKYNKKAPKNKWDYFSAASDEGFKYLHPIGYKILCGVGITALMLPVILYVAYILFINPAPNEWTLMLGFAGAFIVGVGLFNIVAAWIHQYLGHFVTLFCILGGGALTALSLFLLYN